MIFFGSMKDTGIFWVAKKNRGNFFGVAKKEPREFLGMLKKVVIFWDRQILKFFFGGGMKYEPLSDPPSLKFAVSEAPGNFCQQPRMQLAVNATFRTRVVLRKSYLQLA